MYVGISPFLSVLFLEVTTFIAVYLLPNFSAFSRQLLPIACLHLVKSFQLSCHRSILPCLYWLAKYLPKIRQLSICLVHGFVIDPILFHSPRLPPYIFIRFVPHYGKESSLFLPSFYFFSLPHPCCSVSTPLTSLLVHWFFPHEIFMKVSNIFCLFLSFCTFIIAENFCLSIGF